MPKLLFVVLLFSVAMHATAQPLDLLQAWHLAKQNDPQYQASTHEHTAQGTYRAQGLAMLLPQVNLRLADTRYTSDLYREYSTETRTINLTQPIINAQRYYQYRQADLQTTASDARLQTATNDLAIRMAESYFALLAAEDQLQLLQSEKAAIAEQLDQAKNLFERGQATITDVHDAQSQYYDLNARQIEASNAVQVAQSKLAQIIGTTPHTIARLQSEIGYPHPEPNTLTAWQALAIAHNPAIAYQKQYVDIHEYGVKRDAAKFLPTADLILQHTSTNESNYRLTTSDTYRAITVQVNWPLFAGGSNKARLEETRATADKSHADLEDTTRQTNHHLSQAWHRTTSAIARIESLRQAIEASQLAIESNKKGLQAGIRTTIDILNAERRYYDNQTRYLQARYDYLLGQLQLKYHAGTLNIDDILHMNRYLEHAPPQ